MVFAFRPPANDLAEIVGLARVGAADGLFIAAGIGLDAAVLVVGQGAISLDPQRIGGHPFRTVHRGGTDFRSGHAGEDEDFLDRHAGGLRRQGQPFAGHVVIEPGNVERAVRKQPVRRLAFGPGAIGYVTIDELAALIVAHIDHDAPVGSLHHLGVFMLETSECGVLDRRRFRIERVDLCHPAVAVRLVGLFGQVEALVEFFIGVAAFAADTVAHFAFRGLAFGCRAEIAVEVFFAGQIGAPERLAGAAIVHGALRRAAFRIGVGPDQIGARGRAVHGHRRLMRDAAVIGAVEHHGIAIATVSDFQHRHALHVFEEFHLVRIAGHAFRFCRQVDLRVHIFGIDGKDCPVAIDKGLHAVRVLTEHPVRHLDRHARFG